MNLSYSLTVGVEENFALEQSNDEARKVSISFLMKIPDIAQISQI
jgi:hypothetical protein